MRASGELLVGFEFFFKGTKGKKSEWKERARAERAKREREGKEKKRAPSPHQELSE
jgi:hypothetical protein